MTVYYDPKTDHRRVVDGKDAELEAAGWVEVDPEPDEYPPVQLEPKPVSKRKPPATKKK